MKTYPTSRPIGDSIIPENCDKDETKKTNKNKTLNENIGMQSAIIHPKSSEKIHHKDREIDKLKGKLVHMTDKIYTPLSGKNCTKIQ